MTAADPTPPTNLRATQVTTSGFLLQWDPSTDADIYYGGTLGLDSFGPRDVPYVDYNGLPAGSTVEAVVYAFNGAAVRSAPATLLVTTATGAADPTPAVRRAAELSYRRRPTHNGRLDFETARVGLTAALTDPDDPDWLARTLFVLAGGHEDERWWNSMPTREATLWRNRATRFRMTLTGEGS